MTTDFTKVYKSLYTASPAPTIVEAPELPYLIIDGVGDPVSGEYVRAVEALYGVAYSIRFALKPTLVYSVRPLQGRCRADGEDLSGTTDRSAWQWSMIILQPEQATPELLDDAVRKVRKKKPGSAADAVRLERLAEGRCAQILHVGPYATETPAIERLLAFAGEAGYVPSGHHHEIYLSDPYRTAAEKLKTIIRYPIAPAV